MLSRIIPDVVRSDTAPVVSTETDLHDTCIAISEYGKDSVAVINTDGKLVGMISAANIACWIATVNGDFKTTKAGDIMRKRPDHLAPWDTALDALELMLERGIDSLPVVKDGRPLAIVTWRDLAPIFNDAAEILHKETERRIFSPENET